MLLALLKSQRQILLEIHEVYCYHVGLHYWHKLALCEMPSQLEYTFSRNGSRVGNSYEAKLLVSASLPTLAALKIESLQDQYRQKAQILFRQIRITFIRGEDEPLKFSRLSDEPTAEPRVEEFNLPMPL